jgi:hypothetical protein
VFAMMYCVNYLVPDGTVPKDRKCHLIPLSLTGLFVINQSSHSNIEKLFLVPSGTSYR